MRAAVVVALLAAWPDDIARDVLVDALLVERLERLLDDAVLARVERQDGGAPARCQRERQLLHELVEDFVLVVDIDAQGLEDAGTALADDVASIRLPAVCFHVPGKNSMSLNSSTFSK